MRHATFLEVPPPMETGDPAPDLDQEVDLFGLRDIDVMRGLVMAIPLCGMLVCGLVFCFPKGASPEPRRLIGDGVPISATPISGPPELHAQVIKSALQWRFRVPDALKSQAPFAYTITFRMW